MLRFYIALQSKHSVAVQQELLVERYYSLLNHIDDNPAAKLTATDIAYHLLSRSQLKSTDYLIDTYEALERGEKAPFAIDLPQGLSAEPKLKRLANGGIGLKDKDRSVYLQKQRILLSLVLGQHPAAMPFFKSLIDENTATPEELGFVIRYFAKHDEYVEALEITKQRGLGIVSGGTYEHATSLVNSLRALHFNPANRKTPRWSKDASLAAWWPEHEFVVVTLYNLRFGADLKVSKHALEALRPKHYQDNPAVAHELLSNDDKDVKRWASTELKRLLSKDVDVNSPAYSLPMKLILLSTGIRNYEYIDNMFCQSNNTRHLLLKYIGTVPAFMSADILERLATYEKLTDIERTALVKAAIIHYGKVLERSEYSRFSLHERKVRKVLSTLLRGETVKPEKVDIKVNGKPVSEKIVCKPT